VAATRDTVAEAVHEALGKYLGWNVRLHSVERRPEGGNSKH